MDKQPQLPGSRAKDVMCKRWDTPVFVTTGAGGRSAPCAQPTATAAPLLDKAPAALDRGSNRGDGHPRRLQHMDPAAARLPSRDRGRPLSRAPRLPVRQSVRRLARDGVRRRAIASPCRQTKRELSPTCQTTILRDTPD
jgi:hypothetical protein